MKANAWDELAARVPALAAWLRRERPPKLRVVADGRVLHQALALPSEEDLEAHAAWPGQRALGLEGWLSEHLSRLRERLPQAKEVELLGVWAGRPPRVEAFARARGLP